MRVIMVACMLHNFCLHDGEMGDFEEPQVSVTEDTEVQSLFVDEHSGALKREQIMSELF